MSRYSLKIVKSWIKLCSNNLVWNINNDHRFLKLITACTRLSHHLIWCLSQLNSVSVYGTRAAITLYTDTQLLKLMAKCFSYSEKSHQTCPPYTNDCWSKSINLCWRSESRKLLISLRYYSTTLPSGIRQVRQVR